MQRRGRSKHVYPSFPLNSCITVFCSKDLLEGTTTLLFFSTIRIYCTHCLSERTFATAAWFSHFEIVFVSRFCCYLSCKLLRATNKLLGSIEARVYGTDSRSCLFAVLLFLHVLCSTLLCLFYLLHKYKKKKNVKAERN